MANDASERAGRRRSRTLVATAPIDLPSPALGRLARSASGWHYSFSEAVIEPSFRPVSPYRLPPEIEHALWVPVRPIPRPTGTARTPPQSGTSP
jgi:hypothetical protein